jgi:hypothetical protein
MAQYSQEWGEPLNFAKRVESKHINKVPKTAICADCGKRFIIKEAK